MKKYLLLLSLCALPAFSQGLCTVSARFPGSYYCPNDTSTGTTVARLAKVNSGGSGVIITATTDTSGALGIASSGAGTTGEALVTFVGPATCAFDAATTAGHYVSISANTAGQCSDAGAVFLASSQMIGVIEETIGSAGNAHVTLFGPHFVSLGSRRTCDIAVGDTSGSAITNAQLGPQSRICFIPAAATIIELDVNADAGTPNVIVGRNHAGTIANITSAALATAATGGIACSNTGGTTGINGATTCSSTLQNTSLAAGDYLQLVSGTAGGTAKLFVAHIIYTVN